jgi:hypothetical protein
MWRAVPDKARKYEKIIIHRMLFFFLGSPGRHVNAKNKELLGRRKGEAKRKEKGEGKEKEGRKGWRRKGNRGKGRKRRGDEKNERRDS